jgi:hypothetical protein
MKSITAVLIGATLCFTSLQANAVPINVTGNASASGFEDVGGGGAPFDPLSAIFELTYDDAAAPSDGEFSVALTNLMLQIGAAAYDAVNSSAVLTFAGGVLTGVTVGADANLGPMVNAPGTDDFQFFSVAGTQAFRYTSAAAPPGGQFPTGEFQTLATAGANVGDVSVAFNATPQALPLPATSLLLVVGLGLLAVQRRRRGEAESAVHLPAPGPA